jgi:hypothetical protein
VKPPVRVVRVNPEVVKTGVAAIIPVSVEIVAFAFKVQQLEVLMSSLETRISAAPSPVVLVSPINTTLFPD